MSPSPPPPPPAKRLKLDSPESNAAPIAPAPAIPPSEAHTSQISAEQLVGITEYVNPELRGWNGILKQRYTDFLVNEINPDGEVVHLTSIVPPKRNERTKEDEGEKPKEKRVRVEKEGHEGDVKTEPKKDEEDVAVVEEFKLSEEDAVQLTSLASSEVTEFCVMLVNHIMNNPKTAGSASSEEEKTMMTPLIENKQTRGNFHRTIRSLFSGRLATQTLNGENEGRILVTSGTGSAASKREQDQRRGHRGGKNHRKQDQWQELGGEYCHFSLHKENRDTMEVINLIPRLLRLPPRSNKGFSFAGTKDRRAVTVQRCAALKVTAERLAQLNREGDGGLRGCKVGDFSYHSHGLELGDLKGNEFGITLRDCTLDTGSTKGLEEVVTTAVERVKETGFINYFGLQRFGSFGVGTWEIGIPLLASKWRNAVRAILTYNPALLETPENVSHDDLARARACKLFFDNNDFKKASEIMPRKFVAESTILRLLDERGLKGDGKGGGLDYLGAIQAIPRGLRMMYVHAFQSYIWNHVVSARVRLGVNSVREGDLVLIDPVQPESTPAVEYDQDGEIVISAPSGKKSKKGDDEFLRARPLSKEEAESGKWNINDIVLPTPGWDVVYPANELGEVYKDLMTRYGLDPNDMKRTIRDFSLPGGYRKCFARVELSSEVRKYRGLEQVLETDLERVNKEQNGKKEAGDVGGNEKMQIDGEDGEDKEKTAVVLKMKLGTSMYATMVLRELMKDGVRAYKPEFGR